MPRVLTRFGYRTVLATGLLLLGLPACLYVPLRALPTILAATSARGVGSGVAIMALAALVTELAPPARRGEALGLFGVALTLPTVFCGALGLWIVERSGYALVFLIGASAPLLAFFAALGVSSPERHEEREGAGLLTLFECPALRIFLLFTCCTAASGVVTFLPLSEPGPGLFSAATALLFLGVSSTFFRWWARRFGDRRDPRLLLVPGLLCAALGMVTLSLEGLALLGGALVVRCGLRDAPEHHPAPYHGVRPEGGVGARKHAVERGIRRRYRRRGLRRRVRGRGSRFLLGLLPVRGGARRGARRHSQGCREEESGDALVPMGSCQCTFTDHSSSLPPRAGDL